MNAQQNSTNRLTAFVFGAVFNLFAMGLQEPVILFAVKTAIGGFIWLIFQLIGSYLAHRIRRWEDKQLSASEKKYGEEEKHEDKPNNSTNSVHPEP